MSNTTTLNATCIKTKVHESGNITVILGTKMESDLGFCKTIAYGSKAYLARINKDTIKLSANETIEKFIANKLINKMFEIKVDMDSEIWDLSGNLTTFKTCIIEKAL